MKKIVFSDLRVECQSYIVKITYMTKRPKICLGTSYDWDYRLYHGLITTPCVFFCSSSKGKYADSRTSNKIQIFFPKCYKYCLESESDGNFCRKSGNPRKIGKPLLLVIRLCECTQTVQEQTLITNM